MSSRTSRAIAVALATAGGVAQTLATTTLVAGLQQPTSLGTSWPSLLFISEKAGVVLVFAPPFGPASQLLDLRSNVSSFGEHGLSAIEVVYNPNGTSWLFAAYTVLAPAFPTCTDDGAPGNRTNASITGCPAHGRLSKWALSATGLAVVGPEVVVLENVTSGAAYCSQFVRGALADIVRAPDGDLLISAGTGAAKGSLDIGQLGGDPCRGGGQLRAQRPSNASLDGKVIKLNPGTGNYTVLAIGSHHPWRLTVDSSGFLYSTDTSFLVSGGSEEINGPLAVNASGAGGRSVNYGAPCVDGATPIQPFAADPVCVAAQSNFVAPLFSYLPPAGGAASISGIAIAQGRLYFADYTEGKIFSVSPTGVDLRVELASVYPSYVVAYALSASSATPSIVFCDVVRGTVGALAVVPQATSGSAPSGLVASALVAAAVAVVGAFLSAA